MKAQKECCLHRILVCLLLLAVMGGVLAGCNDTPVLETNPPEETDPPVFVEPELEVREVNIQTYYVIGEWVNSRVVAGSEDTTYGPFRSQDFNTFTKWNPQANPGYAGAPGIIYLLETECDLNKIVLTFSGKPYYFELYVSSDDENYTLVADIDRTNAERAYTDGVCTLEGLGLDGIRYVKLVFTGCEGGNTWVNFKEVEFFETGAKDLDTSWMIAENPDTAVIVKGEAIGYWGKDNVNHGSNPMAGSYDNDPETKWNPQAQKGYTGYPGVIYTLDQPYNIKRIEVNLGSLRHYFELYVSTDGTSYKRIANICTLNEYRAYADGICKLDGLDLQDIQYVKMIFTGRQDNQTWVNLFELSLYETGTDGLSTGWMNPYIEKSLPIKKAEIIGQWNKDNVNHGQHPLTASYDSNLSTKWNPAANGGFSGEPGVVYTLDKAYTVKRFELTFTHDHHYFDLYVSADGTEYKKVAAISKGNALQAYGSSSSLVCTLNGLNEENVQYIKLMFTGRVANTTWVNLVEFKALATGKDGLDTSWMLPYVEEPLKIVSGAADGTWLYDNVNHGQHPLTASYDGNMSSKWNPAAQGSFAGAPGVVYTLEKADNLKRLILTFTHDHHYFDVYVSADGAAYKKIAAISAENALKAYGSEESLVCTLDGLNEENVQYIKVVFTGRVASTTWVNLVEIQAFNTGTEGLDIGWMLPEGTEPDEPTEPDVPNDGTPKIVSHTLIGNWLLGREGDPNVGPQLSYDGNGSTKWNPQASGNYAKEQGIIYTLDGWYDLESVAMTFYRANDMYFVLYGSSDGKTYYEIAQVSAENAAEFYTDSVCTVSAAEAGGIKYLKLIFTGRSVANDYVNLYEVVINGTAAEEPESTEPDVTEPEGTEPGDEVQSVVAQITDFAVIGDWANDRVWEDGTNDQNTGPQLCCDGKTTTKWNPAVKSYTGTEGIIFTLDQLYDLKQLKLTFASGEVMYFQLYGSADGVSFTPIADVTAADTSIYSGGVCTLEDISADKVKYIKLVFTGKANNSTWINFYEIEIMALPSEE